MTAGRVLSVKGQERYCLLTYVPEGKIEVTGRQGRRHKEPLDNLKERTGYWKLKDEALDGTLWRTRLGRGYRPIVRQTMER
jgi:hypothetical protein